MILATVWSGFATVWYAAIVLVALGWTPVARVLRRRGRRAR